MDQDDDTAPDARSIANYMLDRYGGSLPLTNLALQKLVFFSHGICLAVSSQPLIRNQFEAWDHGPVVPALYEAFKIFRAAPISRRAVWYDWDADQFVEVPSGLTDRQIEVVEAIVDVYGHLSAGALSDLTHQVDTPWYAVRHPPRGALFLNKRIPDELICHYFKVTNEEIHRIALELCYKRLIYKEKIR